MRFKDRIIGLLVATGFEDEHVLSLAVKLRERGAEVKLVDAGKNGTDAVYGVGGSLLKSDTNLEKITVNDIDALIIPARSSQEQIVADAGVMTLVCGLDAAEKPVGSIGNGVMVLAAAGLLGGRRIAALASGADGLEEYGIKQVEQELVVDRNIVTARSPEALDHFVDVIAFLLEPAPSYS